MNANTEIVSRVLAGEVSAVTDLWALDDDEVDVAWSRLDDPVLTAAAVVRVLRSLGAHPDQQVQRWAAFIREGLVTETSRPPHMAIGIEYEAVHEDDIIIALGRLSELGDVVDGVITDEEREALIARLEA